MRVDYLQECYEVSERRACEALLLRRWNCRYRTCAKDTTALRMRHLPDEGVAWGKQGTERPLFDAAL